jgi:hypothetical protein
VRRGAAAPAELPFAAYTGKLMLEIRPYRGADFDVLVSRWHETNLATFTYLATEQRHTLDDARVFFRESIVATSEI